MTKQSEPRVVVCLFDLASWFLERTNRFPKNWRVTLGDRIDAAVLNMLSLAQKARMRREKRSALLELSEELEVLRTLTRLSCRLSCLQVRQYEHVSRQIDEIGRQLGGWIKQASANK